MTPTQLTHEIIKAAVKKHSAQDIIYRPFSEPVVTNYKIDPLEVQLSFRLDELTDKTGTNNNMCWVDLASFYYKK